MIVSSPMEEGILTPLFLWSSTSVQKYKYAQKTAIVRTHNIEFVTSEFNSTTDDYLYSSSRRCVCLSRGVKCR